MSESDENAKSPGVSRMGWDGVEPGWRRRELHEALVSRGYVFDIPRESVGEPKVRKAEDVASAGSVMPGIQGKDVAIVTGDNAGRMGLEALLHRQAPDCHIRLIVGSPQAFWQRLGERVSQLDVLFIHPASLPGGLVQGVFFIEQVRLLVPRVTVVVLISPAHASEWMSLRGSLLPEIVLDYGAPLNAWVQPLSLMLCGSPPSSRRSGLLSVCEWRALTGMLGGLTAVRLARLYGLSRKTLYAQRYTAMRKLGIRRLRDLLAPRMRGV